MKEACSDRIRARFNVEKREFRMTRMLDVEKKRAKCFGFRMRGKRWTEAGLSLCDVWIWATLISHDKRRKT